MATSPVYAATPNMGQGALTVANTNRDGTGTVVTCFTAGASGALVQRITAKAIVTTTAGLLRVYAKKSTTFTLIKEIEVPANTVSATNPSWSDQIVFDPPFVLAANCLIVCSAEKGEAINVTVEGADV